MAVERQTSIGKQTSRVLNLLTAVTKQVDLLITAFDKNDINLSRKVHDGDFNINTDFHYIIDKSTWILTQHVLFGEELRKLLTYNNIAKELERTGDVIASLAKFIFSEESARSIKHKEKILEELKRILREFKQIGKIIQNPSERRVISNVNRINQHVNIYGYIKANYSKTLSVTVDLDEVNKIISEINIFRRVSRINDYVLNCYEYLMYAITGRYVDLNNGS